MRTIAIIPARGGATRVPGKNIRILNRYPLIYYTIRCAQRAVGLSEIYVSTNDSEIAALSVSYGASVIPRPENISQVHSTEFEFVTHALTYLGVKPTENAVIVILYPTAPFRKFKSIMEAVNLFNSCAEADSLRSVRLCKEHPYKMWKRTGFGEYLAPAFGVSGHGQPFQKLEKFYIQNTAIYITRPATLLGSQNTVGKWVLFYEMGEEESFDINTELDFKIAELMANDCIF